MERTVTIDTSKLINEPVVVQRDQTVVLPSSSKPPKGFAWQLAKIPRCLRLISSEDTIVDKGQSGLIPCRRYLFRVIRDGEGELVLEVRQRWKFWRPAIGSSTFMIRTQHDPAP